MKQRVFLLLLLCALAVSLGVPPAAQATSTEPIKLDMDISKSQLTGAEEITVSIRVSNVGDERMPGPVYLYYPDAKAVTTFGDGGAVMLDKGGFETWQGAWQVTQKQLDAGRVTFTAKYPVPTEDGNVAYKSVSISKDIAYTGAEPDLQVTRSISPTMAKKGQKVTITYDLVNLGNVALNSIELEENKSVSTKKATIKTLEANTSQQVKFEVTMGAKDLTSSAKISYKAAGSNQKLTKAVDAQTIKLGEANLSATLAASTTGVNIGETVKLSLTLKNAGNIGYTNLRVTDPVLGEVFSNEEVPAGATKTLEKEITMMANGEYTFTVLAADSTGSEFSVTTGKVAVSAVDPDKNLNLTVNAQADSLEVYTQPAVVRFTVSVTNTSESEAKDVTLRHGSATLTTFASIKPGETKKVVRDVSISMAGRFQFTAACKDLMKKDVTFDSNVLTIVYSMPTPAPTTVPQRTPPPAPTMGPLPTDAGLSPSFSTAKNLAMVLFGLFSLMAAGGLMLAAVALTRRAAQRKQSEAALDHLERGTRRDYTSPGEEEPAAYRDEGEGSDGAGTQPDFLDDDEFPHMKYVRGERVQEGDAPPDATPPDDTPQARRVGLEVTEDEAAILSGGTGRYRLPRTAAPRRAGRLEPIVPKVEPEFTAEETAEAAPGHTRRRRSAAHAGDKPAQM